MSGASTIHSRTDLALRAAPINPNWILEGAPVARIAELSRSRDGAASTIVWDCTGGRFDWFYDIDETIYFLEGSVVIESEDMAPTRFGPGDVVMFRKGARAHWQVQGYVRKLAFCRYAQPWLIGFGLRAVARLKGLLSRSAGPSIMNAGEQASA